MARELPELGLLANLVEFPAVAKGQARFRLQVMAEHTAEEIEAAAAILDAAMAIARDNLQKGAVISAAPLALAG